MATLEQRWSQLRDAKAKRRVRAGSWLVPQVCLHLCRARHTGTAAANVKAVCLKLTVVFWHDAVFKNNNVVF